ncbi:MAG: DUF1311 domain-containing protein [Granulosicoccus sp.]|nr:DUF1311 domain-containing protein [Granulosicoccus sp.]
MTIRGASLLMAVFLLVTGVSSQSRAQSYNVLKECAALSPLLDDIHACLDNYLDLMDGNISDITSFLAESLSGEALAGLESSQQAFVEYRRQNCLWYLEFSSPRIEAEQIAKNCLATMSQQRLQELRALVSAEDTTDQAQRGFYVYGADRNSFQPCGSDKRFWLEGDNELVNRAQQLYLSIASSDLQVLHAVFAGTMDSDSQAPQGHAGVFKLDALIELRVPTESDCRLPGEVAAPASLLTNQATAEITTSDPTDQEDLSLSQDEPQEQLIAYFGEWVVDCTDTNGLRVCTLRVELAGEAEAPGAWLSMVRRKQQVTELQVTFEEREIDSPARIRWTVDALNFGDIVGSEIRVDDAGTRQLVPASRFVRDELLPMMLEGVQLRLDVLATVDDWVGEDYVGTLNGLTKATRFADQFVDDGL